MTDIDRRRVLGAMVAASAALMLEGTPAAARAARAPAGRDVMTLKKAPMNRIRFGFIGVGMRGHELLRLLLAVDGVEVTAVCDVRAAALEGAASLVEEKTGRKPALLTGSDDAYRGLVDRNDVDAVIIATPWEWHLPMALYSMAAGKETFVEVPAALTQDDCWQLVESSEKHQVNCMMLENCCYGRSELMVLNMVRDGLFGELSHAEGAYIHNLRWILDDREVGEGTWRPQWYTKRKANAYPTHGLGPIAQYMDINRGDRFDMLVSMSSPARSLKTYAKRKFAADDPRSKLDFVLGDMNSSLIQTARGRTILLQHDVSTPRPYNRLNLIQGDRGIFAGYPDRLALDDHGQAEEWITDLRPWQEKYDSPLWRKLDEEATGQGGGHGGMDFVMLWRIVYCLRNGLPLDQNVYDAAAWSVIFDLSEQSARHRSQPRDFVDFTRGVWKSAAPLSISI
jgi:predicted dehydrogenase